MLQNVAFLDANVILTGSEVGKIMRIRPSMFLGVFLGLAMAVGRYDSRRAAVVNRYQIDRLVSDVEALYRELRA